MEKVTVIDGNGNEIRVSEKAFDLVYSHKGFTLKNQKSEVRSEDQASKSESRVAAASRSSSKRRAAKAKGRTKSKAKGAGAKNMTEGDAAKGEHSVAKEIADAEA